jgi:hypothetical protein
MAFDPSSAQLAPNEFDPSTAAEYVPPARGALAEIGTGLARGALVGLPTLVGRSLQYSNIAPQAGLGIVRSAEERGKAPGLTLQPEQHGGVTNAIASAAEGLAPALAPVAAIGAGAAALGAAPFVAGAAGALGAGALFGAQAGQETLEKAEKAGVDENTAKTAARLNAAQTFATQTALGMVGGKALGLVGRPIARAVGIEGEQLTGQILGDLTGANGALMPTLKALPKTAAEVTATNAAQAAGQAAIEKSYGIDPNGDPLAAAASTIGPSLGLTALLGPLGLVTRGMQVRSAKMRTETLASPESAVDARTQLADQYAAELAKANPEAAAAFRANAETAIQNKLALPVDSRLFDAGHIQPPAPEQPTLALPNNPSPLVSFPDGTVGRQAEVDAYIASLPPDQQVAARARLMGMGAQPADTATPAAPAPAAPLALTDQRAAGTQATGEGTIAVNTRGEAATPRTYTFPDGSSTTDVRDVENFINTLPETARGNALASILGTPAPDLPSMSKTEFGVASGLKGQELVREYRRYTADPRGYEERLAAEREAAQAAPETATPDTAAPEAVRTNTQLADALAAATRKAQEDAAYRELETRKAAQEDAIANIAKGEQQAAAAEAGQIRPDANAPKQKEEIQQDLDAAMAANGETLRKQDSTWLQNKLQTLGIADMDSHQAQIDALQAAVDSQKKASPGYDRLKMLLDQWKAEAPTAAEPPAQTPAPIEKPAVAPPAAAETGTAGQLAGAAPKVEVASEFAGKSADELQAIVQANHLAQVDPDALQKALDSNTRMTEAQRERAQTYIDSVRTAKDAQATLGANLPGITPTEPQPAGAAANMAGVKPNVPTVEERATAVKGQIDGELTGLLERKANGGELPQAAQDRLSQLQNYKKLLDEGIASPAVLRDIEAGVNGEAFLKGADRQQPFVGNPQEVDMGLLAPGMRTHRVHDVLTHLADNGSTPETQALARKLADLNLPTRIYPDTVHPTVASAQGMYRNAQDEIRIYRQGANEHTILHESVHAATFKALNRAIDLVNGDTKVKNQTDGKLLQSYRDLESIRQDAVKALGADSHYGLQDIGEFVAELHSNPQFQDALRTTPSAGTSLWSRAVDAVRKMLGFASNLKPALERAMVASEDFFAVTKAMRDFEESPAGAGRMPDALLRASINEVDKNPLDFATATRAVFEKLLPWKTTQYIADRARAIPELRDTGFSAGLDGYLQGLKTRSLAMAHVAEPAANFAKGLFSTYREMTADKARALDRQLMTIGGEASRMGFDFTKNFNDNLRERPDLDPANKAYIDDIHRQYTQLQRTNPKAAEALVKGEQLNRKDLVERVATLASNLTKAMTGTRWDGLDMMDPRLAEGTNHDARRYDSAATATLARNLDQTFNQARALPEGTPLRDALGELERMYRAQERDPYFSLSRAGDYFVKVGFQNMTPEAQARIQKVMQAAGKVVGDLNGQPYAFVRVKSADAAQGLHKQLLDAGQGTVTDTAWGKLQDIPRTNVAGVTPALRTILSSLDDLASSHPGLTAEQVSNLKSTMQRELLSLLPETSSRSAKMQRQGIPGYDADFLNSYTRRSAGAAQDTANLYAQGIFTDAAKQRADALDQLNRTGSAEQRVRAQMIEDEMAKRYANTLTPMDGTMVSALNSMSHSYFLGYSPAFLLRTMTQPWHRGLPWLGSKFGFGQSMGEIARATPTAIKLVAESLRAGNKEANPMEGRMDFRELGLPDGERQFVQELHDRGVLELGQSRQLQKMVIGGNPTLQAGIKYMAMTASYAETLNRAITGLAAYRLAIKRGMSPERATDFAVESINNVMDNFESGNTARAIGRQGFAGQVTPLLTQFSNYSLQTMQQLARTVHDGFFGQDPTPEGIQRGKEARREFAGLLATTTALSGALGLPFVNAVAGVYNSVHNLINPNDPGDIRADMRRFLANTFGNTAGQIIAHGPMATLGGVDTSTLGLQDLLPGSEFLASRQAWGDRLDSQAANMLGPAASMGFGIMKSFGALTDGNYVKAIEHMLPTGLKVPYKTAELAGVIGPGGATDSRGNPLPVPVDASDIGWQALGFQSAKLGLRGEAARDFAADQEALTRRKQLLIDRAFKGITQNGDIASAIEGIREYNAANPLEPITDINSAIRARITQQALGAASGIGVPVSKRQLPSLQQSTFYASLPRF